MSTFRTNLMIIAFWTVSVMLGFSNFFLPMPPWSHCNRRNEHTSCSYNATDTMLDQLLADQNISENLDLLAFYNMTEYDLEMMYNTSGEYEYDVTNSDYTGVCYNVYCSKYDTEYLVLPMAALLLLAMCVIYIRVCVKIYSNSHLLRGRHNRKVKRNKRGLVTTMCIVGTFMVCWLPFSIFTSVTVFRMSYLSDSATEYYKTSQKLDMYLYTLLLLNSLCDPIIYAMRMRQVKVGYHRLLRRCWGSNRTQTFISDNSSSSYRMTSRYSSRAACNHADNLSTRTIIDPKWTRVTTVCDLAQTHTLQWSIRAFALIGCTFGIYLYCSVIYWWTDGRHNFVYKIKIFVHCPGTLCAFFGITYFLLGPGQRTYCKNLPFSSDPDMIKTCFSTSETLKTYFKKCQLYNSFRNYENSKVFLTVCILRI